MRVAKMDLLSAVAEMGDAARMVTEVGGEVARAAPPAAEPAHPAVADAAEEKAQRTTAESVTAAGGVRPRAGAVERESRTAADGAEEADGAGAGRAAPGDVEALEPPLLPADGEPAVLQVVGGAAEATLVAGAVPGSAAVLLAGGGAAAAEEDPGWSLLCTSRTGVPIPAATKMVAKIDNVGIITLEHLEFAVQFELKLKHPLFLELFNEVFGEYVRPADLAEVPRKGRVELVPVDPHLAAAEASLLDQGLDLCVIV